MLASLLYSFLSPFRFFSLYFLPVKSHRTESIELTEARVVGDILGVLDAILCPSRGAVGVLPRGGLVGVGDE